MNPEKQNTRKLIMVLLVFVAIALLLFFIFVRKPSNLHSGDNIIANATPLSEQDSSLLTNRVQGLPIAENAETIIVIANTEDADTCAFYALQKKTDGGWQERINTTAYIGKFGVEYNQTERLIGTTPGGVFKTGMSFGILDAPSDYTSEYRKITDTEFSIYDTEEYRYAIIVNAFESNEISTESTPISIHTIKTGKTTTDGSIAIPYVNMKTLLEMNGENTYVVILKQLSDLETIANIKL